MVPWRKDNSSLSTYQCFIYRNILTLLLKGLPGCYFLSWFLHVCVLNVFTWFYRRFIFYFGNNMLIKINLDFSYVRLTCNKSIWTVYLKGNTIHNIWVGRIGFIYRNKCFKLDCFKNMAFVSLAEFLTNV